MDIEKQMCAWVHMDDGEIQITMSINTFKYFQI
jgi:hypothetical protein